jgi:hypothetical protein
MIRRTVASSLFLLAPMAAIAQAPGMAEGSRERAALAPLTRLVGLWEGDAKAMIGRGEMHNAKQREVVELGAGGTVLIVRGTGTLPQENNRIIHDAAAMIWFDAATNKLRMRAHRMEGVAVEPDIEVTGDTLVWGFAVPGGRVRYTAIFSDTTWHEVGHFLRDGVAPVVMMDMRLMKVR